MYPMAGNFVIKANYAVQKVASAMSCRNRMRVKFRVAWKVTSFFIVTSGKKIALTERLKPML